MIFVSMYYLCLRSSKFLYPCFCSFAICFVFCFVWSMLNWFRWFFYYIPLFMCKCDLLACCIAFYFSFQLHWIWFMTSGPYEKLYFSYEEYLCNPLQVDSPSIFNFQENSCLLSLVCNICKIKFYSNQFSIMYCARKWWLPTLILLATNT